MKWENFHSNLFRLRTSRRSAARHSVRSRSRDRRVVMGSNSVNPNVRLGYVSSHHDDSLNDEEEEESEEMEIMDDDHWATSTDNNWTDYDQVRRT